MASSLADGSRHHAAPSARPGDLRSALANVTTDSVLAFKRIDALANICMTALEAPDPHRHLHTALGPVLEQIRDIAMHHENEIAHTAEQVGVTVEPDKRETARGRARRASMDSAPRCCHGTQGAAA